MVIDYQLHEVAGYINWLYFFHAWGFPSRYANVAQLHQCPSCRAQWLASFPTDEQPRAREAMLLYDDAQALLREADQHYATHAIVALFEANGEGDDILLYPSEGKQGPREGQQAPSEGKQASSPFTLPMLRQQHNRPDQPCLCWADFLLPAHTGRHDTVGLFATSVDEALVTPSTLKAQPLSPHDDYRQMLSQTLADRLAEATAERMHEEVRRTIWGYAADEHLSVEQLFQERYTGRRPAVGYPSLPDQSINFLIDQLLCLRRIGIQLTESGAMRPHASTSGLLFAHPKATHFAIGQIGEDQLHDYAQRRNMPDATMRRFLAANL